MMSAMGYFEPMIDEKAEAGRDLVTAAAMGVTETAEAVLKKGADVRYDNDMALRTAALMGNAEMVRFLVDKGGDPKAEHSQALLYAARRQDEATVAFLVSRGADIQDMMQHHAKDMDKEGFETIDKFQSRQLREVFEKNFARLPKAPPRLQAPQRPPAP
jgi:ankyrin repeat protein